MLFNSIEFLVFLPCSLLAYWLLSKHRKVQNTVLFILSLFFYGWWNWKFPLLMGGAVLITWMTGLSIEKNIKDGNSRRSKIYLIVGLSINLGILALFKYLNFFIDSLSNVVGLFGKDIDFITIKLILPAGISFYTFKLCSYILDVNSQTIEAERNIIDFSAFSFFFPLLISGPIVRAGDFIPQLKSDRKLEQLKIADGLRQMLWGFFKKLVVADTISPVVNEAFRHPDLYSSSSLTLAACLFTIQLYADFSGYSDIAIGTSQLFGFNIKANFRTPLFSRNIAEFWRRWHISLTSWFRDYIYIPLGGSRVPKWKIIRNTFIVYMLCGFWHGANWTYIIWGAINALFFIPLILTGNNRKYKNLVAEGRILPNIKDVLHIFLTFCIATLAFVFFKADSVSGALNYFHEIISKSFFSIPRFRGITNVNAILALLFSLIMLTIEWINRGKEHGLNFNTNKFFLFHCLLYAVLVALIYCFGVDESNFIYFQF